MQRAIVYICLLSVTFISSCSPSDEKKCSKLKRGEFYYKSKVSFSGSVIKRNDSIQLVVDIKTGSLQKEKIKWVDPCAYMLYPYLDSNPTEPDPFPVKVKILDVKKEYYTVNVSSEHYKTDFNDTIWIARLN